MNVEVRPYFAEGEMYPALIGVRAEGDEYETAYVSKSELVDALAENAKLRELVRDMYRRFYGVVIEGWSYQTADFDEYEQRMHELGVEVDE